MKPLGSRSRRGAAHETLRPEPLTAAAFAPFGDVLEATGDFRLINDGPVPPPPRPRHARLRPDARAGISIFNAEPRALPYGFDLIERHPEGSPGLPADDRSIRFWSSWRPIRRQHRAPF